MPLTRAEQLARQVPVGGQVTPPAPSAFGTSSNLPGLPADLSNNSADLGSMGDAVPVSVKDTQAAVKAARKNVDDHIMEVGCYIADVEAANLASGQISLNLLGTRSECEL